jgi:outer membrane protein TolC
LKFFITLSLLSLTLFAQMSIEEAWHNVELKNDGLKALSSDVSYAKLKRESAKSMYLPSVSLSGNYTHLDKPININTSKISNIMAHLPIPLPFPSEIDLSEQDVFLADLHLLWPLYTGGKIDAAQDIYAAQVSEAKALKEMKVDVEFLKLVKYYYGVVVSESLFETREEAQKALELHYENAKKLKEQGQIAKIELLNAEVKLDEARIETTKARHKLQIAKSALFSLTKRSDEPSSKLFVNELSEDESYYKSETAQNYAALKVLDAKERETDSLIEIKESQWLPTVVGYANYNLYKDDSAIMKTLPTWFAGVMVKIDLLQRSDRAQEIQAAKLINSKVKYLKLEALENLALLVEKTYKEMIADRDEFNSLSSSVALAQENYKLRTIAFQEGLSTSVELVDAQTYLLGVKTKRLNAAYNYAQKLSQLCVLIGDREKLFEIIKVSQEIE